MDGLQHFSLDLGLGIVEIGVESRVGNWLVAR